MCQLFCKIIVSIIKPVKFMYFLVGNWKKILVHLHLNILCKSSKGSKTNLVDVLKIVCSAKKFTIHLLCIVVKKNFRIYCTFIAHGALGSPYLNPLNSLTTYSPKIFENCHFEHKHQILEKNYFWTHVTIGSCSTLFWKDLGKISEFSTVSIARY